jgi:hypothetical protein
MSNFLSQLYHLPCCTKDSFIALLLPELNIEAAIREFACDKTRLPF